MKLTRMAFTAKAKTINANWASVGAWTDGVGVYSDFSCSPLVPGKTYRITIEEVAPDAP